MPFEHVFDSNHAPAPGNPDESAGVWRATVSWTAWNPDDSQSALGTLQVMTENTGSQARVPADVDDALVVATAAWLQEHLAGAVEALTLDRDELHSLARLLTPMSRYLFGEPLTGYAVTLDRDGANRAVRLLRRGRDKAYGPDA